MLLQGSLLYGIVTLALLITGEINLANTQQRTVTLNGNGQSTPNLNVSDYRTLSIDVSGTFVATVTVQGSVNGTTWRTVPYVNITSGTVVTGGTFTTGGTLLAVDVSALQYVRLTTTAYTSGSVVLEYFTAETGNLNLVSGAGTSTITGTVTANQGTLASGTAISVVSTASTNASVQKATAGNLFELTASNPTATAAYLKVYNKATAPTVGTDVPVMTLPVPANSFVSYVPGGQGKRLTAGIGIALTAGIASTDTAVAVAGVQIHGTYI